MRAEKMSETKCALLKPQSMTIYEAAELQGLFVTTLAEYRQLQVDLSAVAEIDSAGLQLMVALKNTALKEKKSVAFSAHSREVITFLELFNMTGYFGDPVIIGK